jgi:hypothetical protein
MITVLQSDNRFCLRPRKILSGSGVEKTGMPYRSRLGDVAVFENRMPVTAAE